MTSRFLISTALVLLVLLAGLDAAITRSIAPSLLTEHSHPAMKAPARMVAVVAGGKTFHDPSCKYMHGAAQMMSAEEAIKKGYAPCVRCMREALHE